MRRIPYCGVDSRDIHASVFLGLEAKAAKVSATLQCGTTFFMCSRLVAPPNGPSDALISLTGFFWKMRPSISPDLTLSIKETPAPVVGVFAVF